MFKIILDPGHGPNYNPGAVAGYYEGNAMYDLATYLRDELLKYADVAVTVTRKTISEYPDLKPRTDTANGADLFLSLHSNAHNTVAQGVVIFYSQLRADSKTLANNLCNAIVKIFNDYGSKKSTAAGHRFGLTEQRIITTLSAKQLNSRQSRLRFSLNTVFTTTLPSARCLKIPLH